jgi:lysophospholipase L1-like esterase
MTTSRLLALLLLALIAPVAAAADPAPVKIMPLGDSITQGNTAQDSYRRPLWHKLVDAGYRVDFVGSEKTNFTGHAAHADFDEDNEGHYGWTIGGVLEKLDGWLGQNNPDIVLLHLGTNGKESTADKLAGLEQVVVTLRKHNPKVIVLMAQLITGGDINQGIPPLAKKLSTKQSPVIVVDQATGWQWEAGKDTVDGCHPNATGEEKMAVKWFDALTKILPKPAPAATKR